MSGHKKLLKGERVCIRDVSRCHFMAQQQPLDQTGATHESCKPRDSLTHTYLSFFSHTDWPLTDGSKAVANILDCVMENFSASCLCTVRCRSAVKNYQVESTVKSKARVSISKHSSVHRRRL